MSKKKINIFLQARSNSNRLPFKSLLPINNIPLVILCAKRLMGKDFNITVLTSEKKSDDYLVSLLKKNKINFFRGNLKNVYKRFLDCAKNFDDYEIIIRVTADNPVVNYTFVKNAVESFLKNKDIYKNIDNKKHNLPYGMSLEIFRKNLLLKYKNKLNQKSKEHVTSQFYKYANKKIVKKNKLLKNFSKLSCTIDTFNDYKKINYIFNKFKNPQKVSWQKLIFELKKYKTVKSSFLPKTKYIIGGAQIGNNYMNFKKLNIEKISNKIFFQKHFAFIDTASSYSKSHEKIFHIQTNKKKFNIITKMNYSDANVHQKFLKENFYINFYKILINLNQTKLNTLLIHNYEDFKRNYSEINKIYKKLKSLKLIENFGVSIYYPKELLFLMKKFSNLTIQFPINFIDYRWNEIDIKSLKQKSKISLIGRSIFLRGKLLKKKGYIKNLKINNVFKKKLFDIKKKYNIKSNLELCMRFANSLSYLDYIVIGFENYNQIKQAMKFKDLKFSNNHAKKINQKFKFLNSKYIDPIKL